MESLANKKNILHSNPFSILIQHFAQNYQDAQEITRSTVAAFGDPHLLVFRANEIITCAAPGEQTYLRNRFVRITGTNTVADENDENEATFITAVNRYNY